jgi:acetoin utilization deacetylase AcuC-like enzyme
MKATGIVADSRYLLHLMPDGHPEHPKRLRTVLEKLAEETALNARLEPIQAELATEGDIVRLHRRGYFRQIAGTAGIERSALTADTFTSAESFTTACLAAGGFLAAITAVLEKRVQNAFALVRPPGHHAEASRAMGYCLFNNVALGAAFAREAFGLERILIVDWDVHHGNGTQHLFEADPAVLFFSTHQYPLFPGTGQFTETGRGRGEGYTVNLPMPKGYGDAEYSAIFRRLLVPLAEAYAPELILVSAGFDTHRDDPMAGMCMTDAGFAALTRILVDLAATCCADRLVMVLEGGYHPTAMADSIVAVLSEMAGLTYYEGNLDLNANPRKLDYVLTRCLPVLRPFWPCLD